MAPAQSKLARSSLLLTSMQTKGGAAIVGTLFALLYLRRKLAQAAREAEERRASVPTGFAAPNDELTSRWATHTGNQQMLTTPQIEMAQRDLYNPCALSPPRKGSLTPLCADASATVHRLPGGARELLVPTQGRVSKVVIRPTKASTFARHRPLFRKPPPAPSSSSSSKRAPTTAATAQRVGVNREFFRQLAAILRIIIPHATSKEVWLLGAHTTFLLLRTYLSLLVAQLDGKLVGDLVRPCLSALFSRRCRTDAPPPPPCRSRPMARASCKACATGSSSQCRQSTPTP